MKKLMLMAAAMIMSVAANAQTSPEAKALKKIKTYAEALTAVKAAEAQLSPEDKAFAYNKLVDLAIAESNKAEKAALEAQIAKNNDAAMQQGKEKGAKALEAIQYALKCCDADAAGKYSQKNADRLMTIRNSMVQAGLDCYNTKDYASAAQYFGAFVETRTSKLFAKADFSNEKNFGQIAYYAALAAYFAKNQTKCIEYSDAALASADRDSVASDVIVVKMGALEEQCKTQAIDSATYVKSVKAMYDEFPTNENLFGKIVGLYEETGDKAAAKALLDACLAKDPNNAMANAYVGQAAQGEGKYAEAIAAYEKAVASKPDFLPAKLNLGVCFLNKAAAAIDSNTDARGNIKPEVKEQIKADLAKSKTILEEVKAADPDSKQVSWQYPLERVNYALDNVK